MKNEKKVVDAEYHKKSEMLNAKRRRGMSDIDKTLLVDQGIPERWVCPHCKSTNQTGVYAEETLLQHFIYLEGCDCCGYVHVWELKLTDDFKKKVVEMLLNPINE